MGGQGKARLGREPGEVGMGALRRHRGRPRNDLDLFDKTHHLPPTNHTPIHSCANGGRCVLGNCECPPDWEGPDCNTVSKIGASRSTFEKAINKLQATVFKLNETLQSIQGTVDPTYLAKHITKGMAKALANANDKNEAANIIGEDKVYVPRLLPGPDGEIRIEMQLSPEEKEKAVAAVYVPPTLVSDLKSMESGMKTVKAAKAWHDEWLKRLPAVQAMALLQEAEQARAHRKGSHSRRRQHPHARRRHVYRLVEEVEGDEEEEQQQQEEQENENESRGSFVEAESEAQQEQEQEDQGEGAGEGEGEGEEEGQQE